MPPVTPSSKVTKRKASSNDIPMSEVSREFAFSDADFAFLVQFVKSRTGIHLGEHKRNMVYSRLARRLRQLHFREFSDYCALLESPDGEVEIGNFINSITTNLTHFFREGHHFEHLEQDVLAPRMKSPGAAGRKLRIWSAGCSSGAEAHTITMVLDSMGITKAKGWDARILATDIDSTMLDTGKSGNYPLMMEERIPAKYKKYVTIDAATDRMQVDSALTAYITFNYLNLMDDRWPMKGPFDVIFCRNVLIYFDKETQAKLLKRYAQLLAPGGWLYIGHSENLGQVAPLFDQCGRTTYRLKPPSTTDGRK